MDNDYGVEVFLEAQERADQNDPEPSEHGSKAWTRAQLEILVADIASCAILADDIRCDGIKGLDRLDQAYLNEARETLNHMANHIDWHVGLDKKLKRE